MNRSAKKLSLVVKSDSYNWDDIAIYLKESKALPKSLDIESWFKFYYQLDLLQKEVQILESSPLGQILKNFNNHPFANYYNKVLETIKKDRLKVEKNLFNDLEKAITSKQSLRLFFQESERTYLVRPLKLIYLENYLSLIGEDKFDKCLTAIKVDEIKNCEIVESWKSLATELEVESFIRGIRSVSEIEERLILKIKNPEFFEIQPLHQFLAKPCMITNPEGDLIWSAYVEVGDHLFDWLSSLGGQVEILDPQKIKAALAEYCATKVKKVA